MGTTTSSPSTLASPQPQRRRNRWILWTGRILLGLLALIVLWRRVAQPTRRSCGPATRSAIHLRGSWWMLAATAYTCIASDRAARPSCSMPDLGAFSLDWGAVQPQIATSTRVCAYDRAGLGWSEPGPLPRSPQQFADELHALLTNADVEGPYVLVVHSISGKTARLFASQHPNEVAGMVLVDARHESVDEHLTPEQLAAEDAEQRRFQNMIGWMAKFGLVRLLWAPAWPSVLPGSENLSPETRTAIGVLQARPRQIENALAEGQGRMDSNICFERRRRLATHHSSSWRPRRPSITSHSGRKHNRS